MKLTKNFRLLFSSILCMLMILTSFTSVYGSITTKTDDIIHTGLRKVYVMPDDFSELANDIKANSTSQTFLNGFYIKLSNGQYVPMKGKSNAELEALISTLENPTTATKEDLIKAASSLEYQNALNTKLAPIMESIDVTSYFRAGAPTSPITDLKATAGNGEVSLTFSPALGATRIVLQQSVNGISWVNSQAANLSSPLSSSSTSVIVTGLNNGTTYMFRLEITGGIKAGVSNVSNATPINTNVKDISSFSFAGLTPGVNGVINVSNELRTINLVVPYQTNRTGLVATFDFRGKDVKVGDIPQISGVTVNDFSNPVVYTVTALDGSTSTYTITVTENPLGIASFRIKDPVLEGSYFNGIVDHTTRTINVSVPSNTNLTALTAEYNTTNTDFQTVSVKVNGIEQTSGSTINNFTNPVVYNVMGGGYTTSYTVKVTPLPRITSFRFPTVSQSSHGVIDDNTSPRTIIVTVPSSVSKNGLVATFTASSGAVVKVGQTPQVSGVTANNFSSPVTYTVVGPDGKEVTYQIIVSSTTMTWSGTIFNESSANNGTIGNSITVTLSNASFAEGPFLPGTHYNVSNLPAGLSVSVTRTNDTTAVISLTGNAVNHKAINNISNLGISFTNTAFTGGVTANIVSGSSRSTLNINYINPPMAALLFAPTNYAQPEPGSKIGTTKISALSLAGLSGVSGDWKWMYVVRDTQFPAPELNSITPGAVNYTPIGDDIEILPGQRLVILATDGQGQTKAYREIIIASNQIRVAPAPELTLDNYSLPQPGTVPGTTRINTLSFVSIPGANRWMYRIQDGDSFEPPGINTTIWGAMGYNPSGNITVKEGQSLILLATDSSNQIKAYKRFIINENQIKPPNAPSLIENANYSLPEPGTVEGTTKISSLSFVGFGSETNNQWRYKIQSSPFEIPELNGKIEGTIIYNPGANIPAAVGQRLLLLAVNKDNESVKGYREFQVNENHIRAANATFLKEIGVNDGLNYATPLKGSRPGTTKITTLNPIGIVGWAKWQVRVQDNDPKYSENPPTINQSVAASDYIAGNDIHIKPGQYLILLAVDNNGRVRGYSSIHIKDEQIEKSAKLLNGLEDKIPLPGANLGTTKIADLPELGSIDINATKWMVRVQNAPYQAPAPEEIITGAMNYTKGNDISITPGQYLIIFATDSSNKVKGYYQYPIISSIQVKSAEHLLPAQVIRVTSDSDNNWYRTDGIINIKVIFNKEVVVTGTPVLSLGVGSFEQYARYISGSGSNTLVFRYRVAAGDNTPKLDYRDVNSLILDGGTIRNAENDVNAVLTLPALGTNNSLGGNKVLVVDTMPPTAIDISSKNTIPGGGFLILTAVNGPLSDSSWEAVLNVVKTNTGENQNWITGISGESLSITPSLNGVVAALRNSSSSNANILKNFIIPKDVVIDRAGNKAGSDIIIYGFETVPQAKISNVTSTTANGTYGKDQVINISVTFDRPIKVEGSPRLQLNVGTNRHATYASGDESNTLVFNYHVLAGDNATKLDYDSINSLILNGGTIKNLGTNIDGILTLPIPGSKGSLGANKSIIIDARPPINIGGHPIIFSNTDTATTLRVQVDEAGKAYYVVLNKDASQPSPSQIKAGKDAAGNDLVINRKGSVSLTANNVISINITGLNPSTEYDIYVVSEDIRQNLQIEAVKLTLNTSQKSSAPINSTGYPKVGTKTDTRVDLLVRTNEIGKAYYVVLPATDLAPSPTQVKEGQDSLGKVAEFRGTINIEAPNTEYTRAITGLLPSTSYNIYVVAEDATLPVANLQSSVARVSFVTNKDATPPVFINQDTEVIATEDTKVIVGVSINERGRAYLLALPQSSMEPTAAQVKSGNMGQIDLEPYTKRNLDLSGLIPSSKYDIWIVAEDLSGNLQGTAFNVGLAQTIPTILTPVTIDVASGLLRSTNIYMEYSQDSTNGLNGSWTPCTNGNTFVKSGNNNGFIPGKVYVRDSLDRTNVVKQRIFTIDTPEQAPINLSAGMQGDMKSVKVFGVTDAMEYSFNGNTWVAITDSMLVSGGNTITINMDITPKPTDLLVRIKSTETKLPSAAVSLISPLDALQNLSVDGATGQIKTSKAIPTGVSLWYRVEYQDGTLQDWTAINPLVLPFNLPLGTARRVHARTSESNFRLVATAAPAPVLAKDNVTRTILGLSNNYEYSTDSGISWTPCTGTTQGIPSGVSTVWIRVKGTSSSLPSLYQVITFE